MATQRPGECHRFSEFNPYADDDCVVNNNEMNDGDYFDSETIDRSDFTDVQKFYDNTNIFITGATGFLGKILIEKLLRACPTIQTIYVLIRPKKGKDIHTRLDEMLKDPVFSRLNKQNSKFRHKVVGLAGDCSFANLGLNDYDRQQLIETVNVVFHVAATVKFDENLRLAMAVNVTATKDILSLCKKITNLKSVMHVSTAYSNCHLEKIEEKFYASPIESDDVQMLLAKLDDRQIEKVTPKVLGQWPNTYTFTKALAEREVCKEGDCLPIGVFRPAIVVSTYREPIVGWIDNLYGPTGVVVGACSGLLRLLQCDENVTANIVPVDMCVNALICAAWRVSTAFKSRIIPETPIFNYVTNEQNKLTWGRFREENLSREGKYPFSKALRPTYFSNHSNAIIYWLLVLFKHILPAYVIDLSFKLRGKKPRMMKVYKKIHNFSKVISHFCLTNWEYSYENVDNMWTSLNNRDKELFFFNLVELDWNEYFKYYILGVRVYLMKDPISTLSMAKKRRRRLAYYEKLFKYVGIVVILLAIKYFFF